MNKILVAALALMTSATLVSAAEPDAMSKDSGAMGTMKSDDKMSHDKMGAGSEMKADDKMKTDDKMKSGEMKDDKMMKNDSMGK